MNIDVKDIVSDLTILADKIFIFKDSMTNSSKVFEELDEIDSIYYEIDSEVQANNNKIRQIGPWVDWVANDADDLVYGKQKTALFEFHKEESQMSTGDRMAKDFCDTVAKCAIGLSKIYFNELSITDTPHLPKVFDIKMYNAGASMGTHYDRHPFGDNETILSAVIYLNDDYEGGELYFDQQDITIKPEAGTVIFFPSTEDFTHSSLEVISGTKQAIPLFFYKNEEQ